MFKVCKAAAENKQLEAEQYEHLETTIYFQLLQEHNTKLSATPHPVDEFQIEAVHTFTTGPAAAAMHAMTQLVSDRC